MTPPDDCCSAPDSNNLRCDGPLRQKYDRRHQDINNSVVALTGLSFTSLLTQKNDQRAELIFTTLLLSSTESASGRVAVLGRRLNGFLELSLNDRTILFLVMLLDKTVSVG